MRVIAVPKPLREGRHATPETSQKAEQGAETALQASGRPYTETVPHREPEVEGAAVNEQAFEDVLVTAKCVRLIRPVR